MRRAAGTLSQFDAAQRRSAAAAGSYRAGMQQLGFQINDVATQLASGTRISTVFAQQSGQVIQALQMMSGGTSAFARFMAGPWGVAMTAATVVLLPLIARMFDTRTEVEKATDGLEENARKADLTREAQAAFAQTLPGVTAAIREQTEALRQQNTTLEENQQRMLAQAITNMANLRLARDRVQAELEAERAALARAQAQERGVNIDEGVQAGLAQEVIRAQQRIAALEGQLRSAEAQMRAAEANIRGVVVPIAGQMIEESLDRRAAETGRLRREEAALRREYEAGRKSLVDYTRELRVLRAESAARMAQIQEAERAGRGAGARTLTRPATGALLSPYGADRSGVPLNGRLVPGRRHEGVDIRGNRGDPVVAPESGVASVRNAPGGLGLYVEIRADSGARDLLAHLSAANIRSGQRVEAGQLVGLIGNSGNAARGPTHLHWQRQVNGQWVDPMRSVGASGAAQAAQAAQTAAERAAREAAQRAERRQRDEEQFQQQLSGLDSDIVNARRRQVQTEQEAAAADAAAIRAEQAERDQRIRAEAAERSRRDSAQVVTANIEAGFLLARSQELADVKIAASNAEHQRRLEDQRLEIAQRDLNDQESVLRARGQLARTAMERRDIELRLLALQHQEELLAIQKQRDLTDEQRARAVANANERYGYEQQNTMRSTAGPLEAFLSAIPRGAAEMNEALQSVAVQGLGSIQDALVGVITGTEKMGSAFKKVAASIIADLLRIALQRAIIGPLVNALGGLIPGGSVGGKTDFFGGALNFNFGGARAAGGPVLPGRTYLVGEKGPELLHMGGMAGHVYANANDNAGAGGRVVIELRDEMLQARISEGSQIEIAQAYPAIKNGVMSDLHQQGRRRG